MPRFNVTVEITGQVSYIVEATTQQEAQQRALELTDDGLRFREMDVYSRQVVDCVDESAEYE